MSVFESNSLARYTTPPDNYIGSTFFLSYIVTALYLTSTIAYSLYSQYDAVFNTNATSAPKDFKLSPSKSRSGTVSTRNARARHIKIYTILALISFTSISYHMLGFLITSFLDWSNSSTRNVFAVLGNNGLDKLKTWMLETSLFNDFAIQLVSDGESAVWTQAAILATWGWNVWMARKARQYAFPVQTILPFIVLGQNLPISFAVALFTIQLHLAAPDVPGTAKKRTEPHPRPQRPPVASPVLPTIILNAALLAQPSLRGHPAFSYLLLLERALLVLPHTGLLKLTASDAKKSAAISGGFVVANWAMLRKDVAVGDVVTALVYKGQAVKTMGWDAVLSAVVYGVLSWGGGV